MNIFIFYEELRYLRLMSKKKDKEDIMIQTFQKARSPHLIDLNSNENANKEGNENKIFSNFISTKNIY